MNSGRDFMENNAMLNSYKRNLARKRIILIVLILLMVLFFLLSVSIGSSNMSLIDVCKAILRIGDEDNILIIYNIRLPRALAAIIAGGGLAISGAIMQNVLKNPMASPSTLGVSNASVFGANLAIIVFGAGSYSAANHMIAIDNPYIVSIMSFVFALLSVGVILLLARFKHFRSESIVLAGVAIGTIFQAGTTLIQFFSVNEDLSTAVFWTFGNLNRATYRDDLIMLIIVLLGLGYFLYKRWDYNAISGGSDFATSLGVNVERTTIISLLFASLITAVCVSFLGIIGFVGLIAPQIMKKFIGDDFRYLIPTSFFFGTNLLLVSDLLGRVVINGGSLPVGAITSLLGGPMFIYLLLRERDR